MLLAWTPPPPLRAAPCLAHLNARLATTSQVMGL